MNNQTKLIAFYLPQFHPIPENDLWWGKGFTEWTNVVKAKPLYSGHYQPRLPADLGFYDLRLPETRQAQAQLAQEYGIYGFCYYHYWFGNGRRILEKPFNEMVNTGSPDFPFCLCWANETWEGRWYGVTDDSGAVLIKQEYPGKQDYKDHFNSLLKAFTDHRYITIDGKPLFQVFRPDLIPDVSVFANTFRELARRNGLPGIYLVGGQKTPVGWNPLEHEFDAVMSISFNYALEKAKHVKSRILDWAWNSKVSYKLFSKGKSLNNVTLYDYNKVIAFMQELHQQDAAKKYPVFPMVVNDWDNTARAGRKGIIFKNASPTLFKKHLEQSLHAIAGKRMEEKIVFVKSWNEWAEGNYLEPDTKNGLQYLEAIKEVQSNNDGTLERT